MISVFILHPVYSKEGVSAEELNSKGMQELSSGNNSAASVYFIKAIAADPSKKYFYNNLAASYMRNNDYDNAEQQLAKALKIDPDYTKALSNMSVVLFKTGRYRGAYEYYMRAKKSDPAYTAGRFERRKVLARLKEQSKKNPQDQNLKQMIRRLERESQ